MSVEKRLAEISEKDGIAFMGLIDPTKHSDKTLSYAKAFAEGGADFIVIGGSLGADGEVVNNLARTIKEKYSVPVILFPGNVSGVSKEADALYFMSLMNSRNPYWITGAQALGAFYVQKSGVETIPTSLLIIEPGETVGWVGDAKPIPIHKPEIAAAYALAGKLLGHRITILERGSGAPGPATPEMFRMVKSIGTTVISAGSCKDLKDLKSVILSGADGVHIASMIEKAPNPLEKAKRVIRFAKAVGKKKVASR